MEYYAMKRKAIYLIEKLAERETPIQAIELTVLKEYGFGKGFVRSFLKYLEDQMLLSITKTGEIRWNKQNKPEAETPQEIDPEAEADAILGRSK
jgi:hypothetical protein